MTLTHATAVMYVHAHSTHTSAMYPAISQERRDYLADERSRYANKPRRTRPDRNRMRIGNERADTGRRISDRREERGAINISGEPARPPLLLHARCTDSPSFFFRARVATTRPGNRTTIVLTCDVCLAASRRASVFFASGPKPTRRADENAVTSFLFTQSNSST